MNFSFVVVSLLSIAQVDGRVVFQNGPVPGLDTVNTGTGQNANFVAVNDANQVAGIFGINGNAECDTGAAVLVEDHGTYTMPLCSGMTIGGYNLNRPDGNAFRMYSGILGDNGVIATGAFLDLQSGILRVSGTNIELLAREEMPDPVDVPYVFSTQDELAISDNAGVGYTGDYRRRVYWAPIGSEPYLCEELTGGQTGSIVATESALWYAGASGLSRCQIIDNAAVVDQPFGDGSTLPGPAGAPDFLVTVAGSGTRDGFAIYGSAAEGDFYWAVDGELNATLIASYATADPTYPVVKAVSPNGLVSVIEDAGIGYGEPSTYEVNGSAFFTTGILVPGETRYIVPTYAWFAVSNDATVWLLAATAVSPYDIGNEHTLYRALPPSGQLLRVVGPGDMVTVSAGTYPVELVRFEYFASSGTDTDHASAIANGIGAAVISVALDAGNKFAVLLLGEPQIPDLVPFANAVVGGADAATVPVGTPFDLDIGIRNQGIGNATGLVEVTFTPNIVYTGTAPTNCTLIPGGAATIAGITCDPDAFGSIATQASAFVTLTDVSYLPIETIPGPALVQMEVTQSEGAPEGNVENNSADVPLTLRLPNAALGVYVVYSVDDAEHLIATITLENQGPEDALDVRVSLPGVPAPVTLPDDCNGTASVECFIETLAAGEIRELSIDFGPLTPEDVAAPFAPVVTMTSNDDDGIFTDLEGDPEELLKTDLFLEVIDISVDSSNVIYAHAEIQNLSRITARDIELRLEAIAIAVTSDENIFDSRCTYQGDASSVTTCALGDMAPEADVIKVHFNVATFGELALARVTSSNEDLDLDNNEERLAATFIREEGGGKTEPKKDDDDDDGCSATGTSTRGPSAALALLATLLLRRRRR